MLATIFREERNEHAILGDFKMPGKVKEQRLKPQIYAFPTLQEDRGSNSHNIRPHHSIVPSSSSKEYHYLENEIESILEQLASSSDY